MSSSLEKDVESDVEDDQSYKIDHVKQDIVVGEKPLTNLSFKVNVESLIYIVYISKKKYIGFFR